MKRFALVRVAILAVGVLCLTAACVTPGAAALKSRGMAYLRVANDLDATREFFTPKMRESGGGGDRGARSGLVALPSIPFGLMSASDEQLAKIGEESVNAHTRGKWGRVRVALETKTGLRDLDTTWVSVDGEWYLFTGTTGEIEAYGKPPVFVD